MGSTVCCLIASNRACVVIILRAFPKGLSCPPHNSVISFIVATSTFCFEDISVVSVLSPKKLPGVAVVYIALRGNASLFCPVVLCCVVLCCVVLCFLQSCVRWVRPFWSACFLFFPVRAYVSCVFFKNVFQLVGRSTRYPLLRVHLVAKALRCCWIQSPPPTQYVLLTYLRISA